MRFVILTMWLLCWSGVALGGTVVDATGRGVDAPDHITRVLPAGPPAAVLLASLAPDLMLGWTSPVSDNARALLSPRAAYGRALTGPQLDGLLGDVHSLQHN